MAPVATDAATDAADGSLTPQWMQNLLLMWPASALMPHWRQVIVASASLLACFFASLAAAAARSSKPIGFGSSAATTRSGDGAKPQAAQGLASAAVLAAPHSAQ